MTNETLLQKQIEKLYQKILMYQDNNMDTSALLEEYRKLNEEFLLLILPKLQQTMKILELKSDNSVSAQIKESEKRIKENIFMYKEQIQNSYKKVEGVVEAYKKQPSFDATMDILDACSAIDELLIDYRGFLSPDGSKFPEVTRLPRSFDFENGEKMTEIVLSKTKELLKCVEEDIYSEQMANVYLEYQRMIADLLSWAE